MRVTIREEVLPSVDPATGRPADMSAEPEVARLSDHHELDLGALAGEAISLNEPIAPLCEAACPGLCITCGERLGPTTWRTKRTTSTRGWRPSRGFRVDADRESE
jgi:uncharacterized metal-binding protein YceD (DUF177 family)